VSPRVRALFRFILVAAGLALVAWTVSRLGPGRVWAAAREADPLWLVLSLLPIPLRFLIWSFKWRRVLARETPIDGRLALRSVMAGAFVNHTTPSAKLAGAFLRATLVRRRTGWDRATAYGWALVDQLGNTLGNLALAGALAVAAGLLLPPAADGRAFVAGGVAALAVVVAALALRGRAGAAGRLAARLSPVPRTESAAEDETWVRRWLAPLLERTSTPAFAGDIALAAAAFASLCLANGLALKAVGAEASWIVVAGCAALGYFAGTAVGLMGGIGVTEAALIELYTRTGIEPTTAAAGALLHRAAFYGITLAWGGLALWGTRTHAADDAQDRSI